MLLYCMCMFVRRVRACLLLNVIVNLLHWNRRIYTLTCSLKIDLMLKQILLTSSGFKYFQGWSHVYWLNITVHCSIVYFNIFKMETKTFVYIDMLDIWRKTKNTHSVGTFLLIFCLCCCCCCCCFEWLIFTMLVHAAFCLICNHI